MSALKTRLSASEMVSSATATWEDHDGEDHGCLQGVDLVISRQRLGGAPFSGEDLFEGRATGDLLVAVSQTPPQIRAGGERPIDRIAKHPDHADIGRKMISEADAARFAGISEGVRRAVSNGRECGGIIIPAVPVERDVEEPRAESPGESDHESTRRSQRSPFRRPWECARRAGDRRLGPRDLIGVGVEWWVESDARARGLEGISGVGVDLVSTCIGLKPASMLPGIASKGFLPSSREAGRTIGNSATVDLCLNRATTPHSDRRSHPSRAASGRFPWRRRCRSHRRPWSDLRDA